MPLTDAAIRKAKRPAKQVKMSDERGLYLLLTAAGGKLWRLKYRHGGKEKLLALGAYPDVSLHAAREKREAARRLLAAGTDPSDQKRAEREAAGATFEIVAREWFEKFSSSWSASHRITIISRLEQNVFPRLGSKVIREITASELLSVLRRIESRGANETARRVRQICSQVFRYAIASDKAERDPSADLRGALAPAETHHHAAITEPEEAAGLLRVLDDYDGTIIVRCALRLAPLVFVRPGELRKAEWSEINLDDARWIIPSWRMKMKQSLIVPLSRQAVAILRELHPVTGDGRYVFPSARSAQRPMSDNAILAALRRSGIAKDEMSGHGFRALARTILDEVLQVRVDLIEHQLGHAVKDPNGRAYNRTSHIAERVTMMQQWADYLDALKAAPQNRASHSAR
jgi:integrase